MNKHILVGNPFAAWRSGRIHQRVQFGIGKCGGVLNFPDFNIDFCEAVIVAKIGKDERPVAVANIEAIMPNLEVDKLGGGKTDVATSG